MDTRVQIVEDKLTDGSVGYGILITQLCAQGSAGECAEVEINTASEREAIALVLALLKLGVCVEEGEIIHRTAGW